MPVASELNKDEFTLAEPAENELFDREGLDQKQLRYEFAQPRDLSLDDFYVEREERTALDPRTIDIPTTPTGMGEIGGSGMEVLEVEGKRWDTYRFADGFSVNDEEDQNNLDRQREGVMETMSFLFDAFFLTGMDGVPQAPSIFDAMRDGANTDTADGIPSTRIIDCENFDGDSGDVADYKGHETDLFAEEMLSETDLRILDYADGWDVAVGGRKAIANLRKTQPTDAGQEGPSYLERLERRNLLEDVMPLPTAMQLSVAPRDSSIPDDFQRVPLVDESVASDPSGTAVLGNDELFVMPDMDTVSAEFWSLAETGTPEYYVNEGRMGRVNHDYVGRYTHYMNPSGEYPKFADTFLLKNVSSLFN